MCVVGGQFLIGFVTALLLNREFVGRRVFSLLIMLPWTIPSVVMTLTWQWMYDPFYGLINFFWKNWDLFQSILPGLDNQLQRSGLSDRWNWRGIPFMTLLLLSGLKAIDKEVYEAARVDGANAFQQFRYITLPSLKTIIVINVMLNVMWWWNSFDIQKIMSPVGSLGYKASTLPILAWFESFQWKHLGSGAAISIISLVFLLVLMINEVKQEMKTVKE